MSDGLAPLEGPRRAPAPPTSRLRRLLAWLEERSGLGAAASALARTPLAGGPRWARVTGPVFLALVAAQVATGMALAAHYAPSTGTAWGSVLHLEEQVVLGALLRGVHAFGASAIVVVLALHGLRFGLERAYRAPRELVWLSGLLLVPAVLGFALTGYLLPWDQRGYWATQVASGIIGATPLVGEPAARVFLGGGALGNLTLTRFYALHTQLLPLLLLALLALHLWLARRAAARSAGEAVGPPYWPGQAARDAAAASAVLALVLGLAAALGAGLEAPADPDGAFPPRPEWYFAPLRELLKTLAEPWGSVVLPGLVALLLAALPWLDRGDAAGRRLSRAALLLPLAAYVLLLLSTSLADSRDEAYQRARAIADEDAALARRLARAGIPPEGAGEMLRMHPPRLGAALYEAHCRRCRVLEGKGGKGGPDLSGYLSIAWLKGVIKDPDDPRYYGHTKIRDMPKLEPEFHDQLDALATYVRSLDPGVQGLDPGLVALGRKRYLERGCFNCHSVKPWRPEASGSGPNLHGYGTEEWLVEFLKDPASPRFYDVPGKEMPGFQKELGERELKALAGFLRELAGRR